MIVAVTVAAIWLSPVTLWALAAVIAVGSLVEYFRLTGRVRATTVGWGILWIAVPMTLLPLLGTIGGGYHPMRVLFYVILVWVNDIGAYLVGISIGRHRLWPRLSPHKTWEGFVGGVILTALAAVFSGPRMTGLEAFPAWGWAVFGAFTAAAAVGGDLLESAFKRRAGVKDSGTILPGHGGFLDRFDSTFLSLPLVYVLAYLVFA